MNTYAFLRDPARERTEIAEGFGRVAVANTEQCEPRAYFGVNRCRGLLQDKSFSLTIRSDDGRKLLEARVENMHQAFQKLIDWSIGETGHDVSAVISGPNGFYTNQQIKASEDFAWIESDET